LETDVSPENVDTIYDHLKNLYYMAQCRDPKMLYSSCVRAPEPEDCPLEKRFVTRVGDVTPRFSFIIPIYNNIDYITRVLDHIDAQVGPREDWEIIAVDDGSRECVVDIIMRWAGERPALNLTALRWSRRRADGTHDDSFRAGRARNLGVAHARGRHLAFIDSDILLAPDFLREMHRLTEQYDVVQLTRQMVKSKPLEQLHYAVLEPGDFYRESSYWEDFKRNSDWNALKNFWKYTCTYCLVLKRDDFHHVGGFKAKFNTYGFEDVDIGYRLARLGRRFHLSKMPAYHLFPVPTDHSQHFDIKKRQRSLALSCRQFYFMNLDADIYRDLYTVLNPPTSAVFRALRRMGQARRKVLQVFKWRPLPQTARDRL
jgi:glycosyltransferase involved in cell wall biosynthesis